MSSLPQGAELGSTKDPKELIRGSAEAVENTSQQLRDRASRLEDIGHGLGNVRIDSWVGQASNAFWDKLSVEKPQWHKAADSLTEAAEVLTGHAEAIAAAQNKAADAIDLWERGEAATRQAQQRYDAAVQEANQRARAGETVAPMEPFSDPGDSLRQEAREVLDRARQQLDSEGGDACGRIDSQCGQNSGHGGQNEGQGSPASDVLATASNIASTAIEEFGFGNTTIGQEWQFGDGAKPGADSDLPWLGESGAGGSPSWKVQLAEASGNVSVWGDGVQGETSVGDVDLDGQASLDVLGAQGTSELSVDGDGLKGELSGRAHLIQAAAEGNAEWGIVGAGASAEGFVGADASLEGNVSATGANVGGEAFVGGKVDGDVHGDIGGVGGGLKGEAWAGAGIAADAQIGMQDGEFTVGGEVGAGLGVGGKVGGEFTVDPDKIVDTAAGAADAVGDAAGAVGDAADTAADAVGDAADTAAGAVSDAASSTWDNTLGRF